MVEPVQPALRKRDVTLFRTCNIQQKGLIAACLTIEPFPFLARPEADPPHPAIGEPIAERRSLNGGRLSAQCILVPAV